MAELTRDQKLELIAAYRQAGLHEKARELERQLVAEGIAEQWQPSETVRKLDGLEAKMNKTMEELRTKLGLPPTEKKPKRRR
jgi:hypothetical protein